VCFVCVCKDWRVNSCLLKKLLKISIGKWFEISLTRRQISIRDIIKFLCASFNSIFSNFVAKTCLICFSFTLQLWSDNFNFVPTMFCKWIGIILLRAFFPWVVRFWERLSAEKPIRARSEDRSNRKERRSFCFVVVIGVLSWQLLKIKFSVLFKKLYGSLN